MSYDISLKDPITGDTILLNEPHKLRGGTFVVGGSNAAWLNVTYNYAKYYYELFGEKGIRIIYGMTGKESIPLLYDAIQKLNDDSTDDYWEATEGNARWALIDLHALAVVRPDGVWDGD